MQYDYEIIYKQRKENVVADTLSRLLGMKANSLTTMILPSELLFGIEDSWKNDDCLKALLAAKQQNSEIYKD